MNHVKDLISERLGGSRFAEDAGVYKLAAIKAAKDQARAENPGTPLINMGVGEPDEPADAGIVRALADAAGRHENRFYSDSGTYAFYEAAANYMDRVYGGGS